MKLYPCHCDDSEGDSCACVVGLHIHRDFSLMGGGNQQNKKKNKNSSHLLRDRLKIAAEFWSKQENLDRHWAVRWGTGRVNRFLQTVTGTVADAGQVRGKHLLRMAINSLLVEEGGEKDLCNLLPMSVHRRKIIRLLMQRVSPDYEFLLKDTPREHLPWMNKNAQQQNHNNNNFFLMGNRGALEDQSSSQEGGSTDAVEGRQSKEDKKCRVMVMDENENVIVSSLNGFREQIDKLKPYPVLSVHGPTYLYPHHQHKLVVGMGTPEYISQNFSLEQKQPAKQLIRGESTPLQPGIEINVVPRFRHAGVQLNPPRQSFKWLREEHQVSFDIEWSGEVTEVNGSQKLMIEDPDGVIEFWVGPILIGTQKIEMLYGDEEDQSKNLLDHDSWKQFGPIFHSIVLLYSPRDSNLCFAIEKSEKLLKGCISTFHAHKESAEMPFLLVNSSMHHHTNNIQLCLSESTQGCSTFLSAAEKLIKSMCSGQQLLNKRDRQQNQPDIVAIYWSHPKPDLHGHPVLSQILGKFSTLVFYNHWLIDLPLLLSESGFKNMDIDDFSKQLIPGLSVAFRLSNSENWERGRITAADNKFNQYDIVSDVSGENFKNIPKQDIRILTVDTFVPNRNQDDGVLTRSRKGKKDIVAQLVSGDHVYAKKSKHAEYQPGIIVHVHEKTRTVDIAFENGEAEAHLDIKFVRVPPQSVGARYGSVSPTRRHKRRSEKELMFRDQHTGKYTHGTLVQVSITKSGERMLGRVRRALDYGLKYDVMLSNGELMEGVPVHNLSCPEDHGSSGALHGNGKNGRTYVEAMCDRFRQVLNRAARVRPDGRDLRLQFESLDQSGNGVLCAADFKVALQSLGFRPSEFEVLEFMDRISNNNPQGTIDYGTFVRFALPMGVINKERSLKKSLTYYETSLNSIGLLEDLERALGNNMGKLWLALSEQDASGGGHLTENELHQVLVHLNIGLTPDQRQHLLQCFGSENMIDYKEFASVVELLLAKSVEQRSMQHDLSSLMNGRGQHKARRLGDDDEEDANGMGDILSIIEKNVNKNLGSGNDDDTKKDENNKSVDEIKAAKVRASSEKLRRLMIEHKAASRIQGVLRRRLAIKSMALRQRDRTRLNREAQLMKERDGLHTSSWWVLSNGGGEKFNTNSTNPQTGVDDETLLMDELEQRHVVIEKWRKLLHLNSKGGLEIVKAFRTMDKDCDGSISLNELSDALEKNGVSSKFSNLLFREMDTDNDGDIDFGDFKLFVSGSRKRLESNRKGMKGPQLLIEELGKDLCAKLRRYYFVLQRCGTNLLDYLLYRPRNLTICSVLRKQGFVLSTSEWKRLEVLFASMIDHRGDRVVCEDLMSMLSCSDKEFDEQEYAQEELHIKEFFQNRTAINVDLPKDVLSSLGRVIHRIVQSLKLLCKDSERRKDKHKILWWLLETENQNRIYLDRLDLELFLTTIKVRARSHDIDQIVSTLDENRSGKISARDVAKLLMVTKKFQEYLQSDYRPSRFCRNYIISQRNRLEGRQGSTPLVSNSNEVGGDSGYAKMRKMRSEGLERFAQHLFRTLGGGCYKKIRSMLIAAKKRGNNVDDGSWLTERLHGKLGYIAPSSFQQAMHEMGVSLSSVEQDSLLRCLMRSDAEKVDLFEFSDVVQVILATTLTNNTVKASLGICGGNDSNNTDLSTEENYLRRVVQDYIRRPNGHRNIISVFENFDVEKNGLIDLDELENVFRKLGIDVSKVNVPALFERFDGNGDKQLDYVEFLDFLGVQSFGKHHGGASSSRHHGHGGKNGNQDRLDEDVFVSKLIPMAKRLHLTVTDVNDACGKIGSNGLMKKRDLVTVFNTLGLFHTINDSDMSRLQRVTLSQLRDLLIRVVKAKVSIQNESKIKVNRIDTDALVNKRVVCSGQIALETKVEVLKEPYMNAIGKVVKSNRSGYYDCQLHQGTLMQNVKRTELRILGGRPAYADRVIVVNKHNQEKGVVIRVCDHDYFDVRINNRIIRKVPKSQFAVYQGRKDQYGPGMRVECLVDGDDLFYSAKIAKVNSDGTFAVEFDHGERHSQVPFDHLRPKY